MLYSGNLPCTGSSSETGPCDSKCFLILCTLNSTFQVGVQLYCYNFQLKGLGQCGTIGVLALVPAIQILDSAQCSSVATVCARPAQLILDHVTVRFFYIHTYKLSQNFISLLFSVEGSWTVWDNWGTCSGTCNTNTRERLMLYSGNLPCSDIPSEAGPCDSKCFM